MDKPPNPLLVENYQQIHSPKQKIALDLGAGIGNEAVFLLKKGWPVVAFFTIGHKVHAHIFEVIAQNVSIF